MTTYSDYPKDQIVRGAENVLQQLRDDGVEAHVYFKASCPACGERCAFEEPDTTFETMECCKCGTIFPFTEGNYMIVQIR